MEKSLTPKMGSQKSKSLKFELIVFEEEPRIDHRLISHKLGVKPKATFQLIKHHQKRIEKFGLLPSQMEAVARKRGVKYEKYFILNESQSIFLLTLSRNTEMEKFIGTKIIKAAFMNLGDYNNLRGWTIPEDENPTKDGYLVGYSDADGNFDGDKQEGCHYISWSPVDVFEASYCPITGMSFSQALDALKIGKSVRLPPMARRR